MTDAEYEVVFEKFKAARMIFIKYLRVHSNSTRQDLIDGLGWYPEKVDIFLDLLIRMGMAIPSPSSSGETRYQFEELFVALRRKRKG
jgi:hypothetical protein